MQLVHMCIAGGATFGPSSPFDNRIHPQQKQMPGKEKATEQQTLVVERIKQYPGLQQVDRAVMVLVPGKHFPQLTLAEQKVDYEGTAVEHGLRHAFGLYRKAWGLAHTGAQHLLHRLRLVRAPLAVPDSGMLVLACAVACSLSFNVIFSLCISSSSPPSS